MKPFVSWLLRHRTIRAFWQIFLYIVTLPLFFIGYLIPQNPEIWVFANIYGFKDNARYLFEYVLECHPEITPIWLTSSDINCASAGRSYSRMSLVGLWFQYRAGIAFVSTGFGDLTRCTLAGTKIVQLWHGIPIKRILLDSPESIPFGKRSGVIHDLSLEIFRRSLRRYAIVIASSKTVQCRLKTAFGLPGEQVAITGYPRHDILFENSKKVMKRILYAPTWRGDIHDAFTVVHAVCNPEFISRLKKMGYELWVSIHPLNRELTLRLDDAILDAIKFIEDEDINIILAHSEILITDYSSIALDFAMLNRKVIYYVPDAHEYLDSRGVYEEFETLLLEKGITDANDILTHILDEDNMSDSAFSELFFQYHDSDARERIVGLTKKLC